MTDEIPAADTAQRLARAQNKADRRKYEEKRNEAGFTNSGDYDTWLLLEKLRALTLEERRATERAAEPKRNGGITLTGPISGFSPNYTINQRLLQSI